MQVTDRLNYKFHISFVRFPLIQLCLAYHIIKTNEIKHLWLCSDSYVMQLILNVDPVISYVVKGGFYCKYTKILTR